MATLTHSYKPHLFRIAFANKFEDVIEKLIPRRCMIVSVSLILAGLGIPALMALGLLPVNWLLGFMAFALTATGSVSSLILCGEI
ncbi:MAG: hypothetical protein EHM81_01315 [Chloroflexi bacterium]|nr:MAG: hypothetical protein EHM81_01315 [Chloroflexota bacterium]